MTDATDVAFALLIDRQTASLVRALRAADLEPILLKGPSFAAWLYADGTPRAYIDTDLLVDPDSADTAASVLCRLGFQAGPIIPGAPSPSVTWSREGGPGDVDLHTSITFFNAKINVWAALMPHTEMMSVGGGLVRSLDDGARAVHVVTHAVQDSFLVPRSNEDLRRAVQQVPDHTWARAFAIAHDVGAADAFAEGLWATADGCGVAERVGVARPSRPPLDLRLRLTGDPDSGAPALVHLYELRTWRDRVAFLRQKILPSPAYLSWAAETDEREVPLGQAYLRYWSRSCRKLPRAVRHLAATAQWSAR